MTRILMVYEIVQRKRSNNKHFAPDVTTYFRVKCPYQSTISTCIHTHTSVTSLPLLMQINYRLRFFCIFFLSTVTFFFIGDKLMKSAKIIASALKFRSHNHYGCCINRHAAIMFTQSLNVRMRDLNFISHLNMFRSVLGAIYVNNRNK